MLFFLFLLVLFAFFSAALAALDEASRTRLGELEKRGLAKAAKVLALLDDGGRAAGALAVGQVLCVAAAAAIAASGGTRPSRKAPRCPCT